MAEILFISKPLAPPWNDSGKNLVRDVAGGLTRHRAHAMGTGEDIPGLETVKLENIYPKTLRGFSLSRRMQARVFARLVFGRRYDLWHFFFAPNLQSSMASSAIRRMRGVPAVHTISSAPHPGANLKACLFADVHVVLSRHTEARLVEAHVQADRIVRIPPGILSLDLPHAEERRQCRAYLGISPSRPVVLYAGDLEFGDGAEMCMRAVATLAASLDVQLVIASRMKTAQAVQCESRLRELAKDLGITHAVSWVGEVPDMRQTLLASDVLVLSSQTLYAKMDYPLVVLEAMSLERAVILAHGTPAAELAQEGGAIAIEPNSDALTAAISALIEDDAYRRSLGEAARQLVLNKYDRATMAKSYEALYDRLLR
ncbi:MAG: glycosyltransferase family 4 protein [Myxococcales bacterium]|nr:glycosyltransferase family 4 protein [Myxococcales bacterium]MCB9708629.1 glycosyltransferase family 4 protein [Myxococcales bacterium]